MRFALQIITKNEEEFSNVLQLFVVTQSPFSFYKEELPHTFVSLIISFRI
jgi:hypothetical protein